VSGPWDLECTDEFNEWYGSLEVDDQEDVRAWVEQLRQVGPGLGRPAVDQITSSKYANMKELISGSFRILFIFDPRQTGILLLGGDKKGLWNDWYDINIPIAEELYEAYLNELSEEGLL
jgi:hypothetical protein